jgi:hypothetical protein
MHVGEAAVADQLLDEGALRGARPVDPVLRRLATRDGLRRAGRHLAGEGIEVDPPLALEDAVDRADAAHPAFDRALAERAGCHDDDRRAHGRPPLRAKTVISKAG